MTDARGEEEEGKRTGGGRGKCYRKEESGEGIEMPAISRLITQLMVCWRPQLIVASLEFHFFRPLSIPLRTRPFRTARRPLGTWPERDQPL